MTREQNFPAEMNLLRLDYLLNSNTVRDQRNLEEFRSSRAGEVKAADIVGEIYGREVVLHQLLY